MPKEAPLISIVMITYNHAPYIEQAMESCLSQETSFPFELIVCDDASTDGTAEIIEKWAKKHHNLVFLKQPVNGRGANNFMDGLRHVRSKYIAFCEGDDYWISPQKLEKQVRFLEENPDFSVCCHKVELKFENRPGDEKKQYIYKDCSADDDRIKQGIFYADEAIANYYFQTSSYVFRWRFREGLPNWFRKWMLYDHALMMLHAVEGKIKYFDEAMSVWRRNETGYSWLQNIDKGVFFQKEGYDWIKFYQEMDNFFAGRFHLQIRERILLALRSMISNCLETGNVARMRKIAEDHQEWFLKLVKENASLFEAVKLAFPDQISRVPPWAGRPQEKIDSPPPTLGGMMELDLMSIPENPDSVWSHWTRGREYVCFSSPLTALVNWLFLRRVRRVWLPVITPPALVEELERLWIPHYFYPVGGTLSPSPEFIANTKPGDAVLTRAWFGRPPSEELSRALTARKNVLWIDDRSTMLDVETSCGREADVIVYSPANVLGVPDGGILIGEGVSALQPPPDEGNFSEKRGKLLLERFEHPVMDSEFLIRKQVLELENPLPGGAMSRLTASMLKRISLSGISMHRKKNWKLLHEYLHPWALWQEDLTLDFVPTAYPLLIPETIPAAFIRTALNQKGILCESLDMALANKFKGTLGDESELLRRLIFLPCDHQHDENDMHRIIKNILQIFHGRSDFGTPGTRTQV